MDRDGLTEREIACILSSRWVPKVRKYVVKLAFRDERAEEVWMSERQLSQIENLFGRTPHGHSSSRLRVAGYWNDRGYYAYSRLIREPFQQPIQYRLDDLKEDI